MGMAVCAPAASAQPAPASKQAQATRVTAGSIALDGRLDEAVWRDAVPLTDFLQREPSEGAPPSDPIDVRLVYDNSALYVGARMSSSEPVQAPMGRRDQGGQAEHILISLDTYLDRRTASTFGITAAGVRLDRYYASDDLDGDDSGYDPVWQGRVSTDAGGWTAELWIPFSQLRFNERDVQVWGLNVQRFVPSRNEEVFWSLVPRTESRWASLFGDLHGIQGIRPSRRLELMPYVAGSSHVLGVRNPANPFTSAFNGDGRIGLDAKVGLGPNLTLEATVNPDFGQVEADPAEVNLTAFETFFDERRPFFLEGSQLLTGFVNNYFYSRRIGASPVGRAAGDFVDPPSTATILGAAKLTGRLASGTSVGALGAVTAEEWARTFTFPANFGRSRVAPRTLFGVGRVEQEFGPPGSTIGVMTTMVRRDLEAGDPLAALVSRNAFSISTDAVLRLNDGEYEARGYVGASHVDGDPGAIARLQRSSARYFQRPDIEGVRFDPTRTSMSGVKAGGSLQRRTGTHWNWVTDTQIETAGFETNDLGRTSSVDQVQTAWRADYRETVPGAWWRNYTLAVGQEHRWTLSSGDREQHVTGAVAEITWLNFWETEVEALFAARAQEPRLTRGGPTMETPRWWRTALEIENSSAATTRTEFATAYRRDEDGGLAFEAGGRLSFRPGSQWQISFEPRYDRAVDTQQYVTTLAGGRAETFGSRFIFGRIDRSTYATEIRTNYTFQPDLTLDLYAEPFAASGRYHGFGELAAARGRLQLPFTSATAPAPDFNVQSFRSNLVLRWEWRAGSTLYLVWQQDRAGELPGGTRASLADMFESLRARGDNFFAVKASWWYSPR